MERSDGDLNAVKQRSIPREETSIKLFGTFKKAQPIVVSIITH